MKFTFIDLFAEIGEMRLGFESACEEKGRVTKNTA